MKTFKRIVLMAFVALSVMACKKDDDGGGDGGAAEGTVAALVSGTEFNSNPQFSAATRITAGGSTTLSIQGSDNSGKGIVLLINGFDGAGSYDIGGGSNVFVTGSYVEANANNPQNSQSWMAPFDSTVAGEINISEISDTNVKGTFNFKAKNSNNNSMKEVTNGTFNINF